jgi:hypothetical protein
VANRRRPEADDLLRMAEHRRSMHALRRVAVSAAEVAERTRHLHVVRTADVEVDTTVVSLAAERARRAGHPSVTNRTS